ncbi:MAG: hypothetical protein JKY93_03330 [Gammaproteobacteria bacterium]|nr:hypothetical protein [Gammaproteobacteria bacterium]
MMDVRFEKGDPADAWAFSKWGDKLVLKQINPFVSEVALRVSQMPQGDLCEHIEVGGHTHRKEVFLFADFSDGVRGWFRSSDIENPVFVRWDDQTAAFPFDLNG